MKIKAYIKGLMDARDVDKAMLIPFFLLPISCQYLLLHILMLIFPMRFFNLDFIYRSSFFDVLIISASLLIICYRNTLKSNSITAKILPYFLAIFYVITMFIFGSFVGIWSIAAGVVICATPLLAFILFPRKLVYIIIATGLSVFGLINVLIYFNIIGYAPAFTNEIFTTVDGRTFYFVFMMLCTAPHLFAVMFMNDLLLSAWRKREAKINHLSVTDGLLNMNNRRAIVAYLESKLTAARDQNKVLSVILLDIDHFKKINDMYGHLIGDIALKLVGETLVATLRQSDCVGRYGGEEFLIVLDNTDITLARQIAERCRQAIAAISLMSDEKKIPIEIRASFGVYAVKALTDSYDEVMRHVDVQLYRAKEKGRNQVCWEV